MRGAHRDRHRDQRGGVAVFVAVVASVLLLVSALAVDLGQQRVGRRDMQALADVVALDMARLLRGRTTSAVLADPEWSAQLAASVARNPRTLGSPPQVTAEPGLLDPATGAFTASSGAQVPNAVRVTARTQVAFSIMPGDGAAVRTAVGAAEPVACFRLGSYAAAVDSGSSALLNGLVGDALDVTAVSYDGLADARITLLGLATELGVGTVDGLLDLPALSLGQLFLASAAVLQREGGQTADVDLLRSVAAGIGGLPPVRIGDLLSLAPGSDAALATSVAVLDLVATSAFVANGSSFLEVPGLAASLGVGSLSTSLRLVQRPQTGCGRAGEAQASTSQLALPLSGTLLGLPGILGTTASGTVQLDLQVASANGRLGAIGCGAAAAPSAAAPDTLSVSTTDGLVSLRLTVPVTLRLLGLPVLRVTARVTATPGADPETVLMTFPSTAQYDVPTRTGLGSAGLGGLAVDTSDTVLLGALPLGVTTSALVDEVVRLVVSPLVQRLDAQLITPLLDLLGAQVSGADVYGVARPDCTAPALRG